MKLRKVAAVISAVTMLSCLMPAGGITARAEEEEKWTVEINEENFPDANLREYLLYNYNVNSNRDNKLTYSEMEKTILILSYIAIMLKI